MSIDRRWLTAGAGLSLIVNIFLVGVIAGHVLQSENGRKPESKPNNGALIPQAHVRSLPKDERRLFNTAMATHRDAIRDARQAQQKLRQAAEVDISAPTFDKTKVEADLKALREANLALQEKIQSGLVEALAPLSQSSRAVLVEHENETGGSGGR